MPEQFANTYFWMMKYFQFLIILFMTTQIQAQGHYADVNGLHLYYEIHGKGDPLVLIHGGGSTIHTTFGRVLPIFAKSHQVIAVEMQAHGHTRDIDRPLSFQQDADDIAALLRHLHIKKASLFGFSNGASTAMQVAIRHPEMVNKLVIASTMFTREGAYPQLWQAMKNASLNNMPRQLQEEYLKINPDTAGLQAMHDRDAYRMLTFKDWDSADIKKIQAPSFVIVGDADIVKPEHAVEMYRLLPHGRLAILPGGHGDYIGEITTLKQGNSKFIEYTAAMIEQFLKN
jgi:pimeloyl-ACP methyl ester carboxylesterase